MDVAPGLSARQIRTAGEFFVLAVIASGGLGAQKVDLSTSDIVVERDSRLLRVEVKTQLAPAPKSRGAGNRTSDQEYYRFMTHKARGKSGSSGLVPYQEGDWDLMALAGLRHDKVAFLTFDQVRPRMSFPSPEIAKPEHARLDWRDHTLEAALARLDSLRRPAQDDCTQTARGR